MNSDATGTSGALMLGKSLSAIAAKTIGIGLLPVSRRYDASAAAPAGLWAASISNSPLATRSHSSRAGQTQSVSPVTIASVGTWLTAIDHRSRIATAMA